VIRWHPEAADDLDRLLEFLLERNVAAVPAAVEVIESGLSLLGQYPEAGRPLGDGTGRREATFPYGAGSYVLRYRIHEHTVFILRAWHSRESRT